MVKSDLIQDCRLGAMLLTLLVCQYASGQSANDPQSKKSAQPIVAVDTSSPRETFESFITACNEFDELLQDQHFIDPRNPAHRGLARRITDCLDSSQLPEFARTEFAGEAAVCLKEIIDRLEIPPYDEIPDTEDIEAAGGYEKLTRWRLPGARITIARIEEGAQKHEYLFTAGTVERAVEYYEDVKHLPYRTSGLVTSPNLYEWYVSAPRGRWLGSVVEKLPRWARERRLGITVWKWPGLILSFVVSVVLMGCCYGVQSRYAQRLRETHHWILYCFTILFAIAAMLVPLGFRNFVENTLTIRATPLYLVSFAANAVALLAATIVIFGISNRVAEAIIASQVQPKGLDAQLIRIVCRMLSLAGALIVLLEGGRYLGIPITTLLASAGVGGLALALAAQDTVKSLFGTITLMADKPFRVGDRIIFQDYDGVVEDIGLRSTRLRLLTGHQATVPNDELARTDIENVGRRQHIRRVADLKIPINTPVQQVELAVDIIRQKLANHQGMNAEFPPRVFFTEFQADAFNIRFMYWYHPPDYWNFLEFSERLNLDICQAFDAAAIQFSLPARITYTAPEGRSAPVEVQVTGQ